MVVFNLQSTRRSIIVLLLLLLYCPNGWTQVRVVSWNLQNFGKSKTTEQIDFIATTVQDFDVVALQEIVAGAGGAQSVARLADALDRTGADWDYIVSDPSNPSNGEAERYAFLWKTSVVKRMRSWLDDTFIHQISREPYFTTFLYEGKQFTISSFHALPKKKQPETEIKYLKFLAVGSTNLIFVGDFNLPQSHTVFNPLRKMGWQPAFTKQKTTLKMECRDSICLASEYDNIWMPDGINLLDCGVIHFYEAFDTMKLARKISDHIPVYIKFSLN